VSSARRLELALRRERLQLRCAAQRSELAATLRRFMPVFAAAEALRSAAILLKSHPEWLAAAAGVALVLRPWGLLRWGRRAFAAWRAWRRVSGWLERTLPAPRRAT